MCLDDRLTHTDLSAASLISDSLLVVTTLNVNHGQGAESDENQYADVQTGRK